MVPKRKRRRRKLVSRTRQKATRKHAATRPNAKRGAKGIPKDTGRGTHDTVASTATAEDKRPAWLREHGKDCTCIGCYGFKLEVMPIYTGHSMYSYRCPYCGQYISSNKAAKAHMGKVPNIMATCPQLQIGVSDQGKVLYRDIGNMEILQQ